MPCTAKVQQSCYTLLRRECFQPLLWYCLPVLGTWTSPACLALPHGPPREQSALSIVPVLKRLMTVLYLIWTRVVMQSGNLSCLPKSTRSSQSAAEVSRPVVDRLPALTKVMFLWLLVTGHSLGDQSKYLVGSRLVAALCQGCWAAAEKVLKWSITCVFESHCCPRYGDELDWVWGHTLLESWTWFGGVLTARS